MRFNLYMMICVFAEARGPAGIDIYIYHMPIIKLNFSTGAATPWSSTSRAPKIMFTACPRSLGQYHTVSCHIKWTSLTDNISRRLQIHRLRCICQCPSGRPRDPGTSLSGLTKYFIRDSAIFMGTVSRCSLWLFFIYIYCNNETHTRNTTNVL